MSARDQQSVRHGKTQVYYLLQDLVEQVSGTSDERKRKEILRHVNKYMLEHPTPSTSVPYDETSIVAKIRDRLGKETNTGAACDSGVNGNGAAAVIGVRALTGAINRQTSFQKHYEMLRSCHMDNNLRNSVLAFLYALRNQKPTYENGHQLPTSHYTEKQSAASVRNSTVTLSKQSLGKLSSSRSMDLHPKYMSSAQQHEEELDPSSHSRIRMGLQQQLCTIYNNKETTSLQSSRIDLAVGIASRSNRSTFTLQRQPLYNNNNDNRCNERGLENEDIVQNIIYSFTGIQGKYLKKDVITGRLKLDPREKGLSVSNAAILQKLSILGYYYDLVQTYADTKSGLCALGLLGQGFISALKEEITSFIGTVSSLQEQLNRQHQYYDIQMYNAQERLTPLKLLVWWTEPVQRLQWLTHIAAACQEKKGGILASTVYEFLNNGNPMVKTLAQQLLITLCNPLCQMLTRWLLDGEICDPYGEFFIECLTDVRPDRLWHDKYRLRREMLPKFIPLDLAYKILVAGKSINFLCEICEDAQPVKERDELRKCFEENPEHLFAFVPDTKLHATIETIYLNTSKRVLNMVVGPYKLLEHLQAMRRYLLLGQGDFIGILMENLKNELDKPAKELYTFDLSTIMDGAIRSTNAQYDDPEILNYLDVRLLAPCDGDVGWDIITLQYTVRGPLATLLEPSMTKYQSLFKPLWRMKHMEFVLSTQIWKDQICNAKALKSMTAELNNVTYRLHLVTSEMMHFIHQMQYYILFEVIECSWATLHERLQRATSLDDILFAHDEYLNSISDGAFLDANSGDLSTSMERVYEGIILLEVWQKKFYQLCFDELEARQKYDKAVEESEKTGEYGTTSEKQLQRKQERKVFEQKLKSQLVGLNRIASEHEMNVRCFLLNLNSHNDHNLQLFGIRLDFNEYYKKRDQRLGVPLTFEHMRMSNVLYNTTSNRSLVSSRMSAIN